MSLKMRRRNKEKKVETKDFLKEKSNIQGVGKSRKHNCTFEQRRNDTCPRSTELSYVELNVVGTKSQKAQMSRKWDLPYSFIR